MILNVKLLPDGTGRTLIHWLIEGDGLIEIQGHEQLRKVAGQSPQVRGRIACNPLQNSVNPMNRGGETLMCLFSNDVRAATCPKCIATQEAIAQESAIEDAENRQQSTRAKIAEDAEKAHALAATM